jgi:hypothetical protein
MKTRKDKRGGTRQNAGRPHAKDKKLPIRVFIHDSKIKKIGGEHATKLLVIKHLENI